MFLQDPHPGNLLIRPAPVSSRSPYNFEIVLLDHGLYFDLDDQLRVNYGKFWLSLTDDSSPSVQADRRRYAKLVGNIGPDLVSSMHRSDGRGRLIFPASILCLKPLLRDERPWKGHGIMREMQASNGHRG